MRRFKVGDLARFVVATVAAEQELVGLVVEITDVGGNGVRFDHDEVRRAPLDYWFHDPIDGNETGCFAFQLAPVDPPAERVDIAAAEEIGA